MRGFYIAAIAVAAIGFAQSRPSHAAAAAVGGAVQFCTSGLQIVSVTAVPQASGGFVYNMSLRNRLPNYTVEFTTTFKGGAGTMANSAMAQPNQIPAGTTRDYLLGSGSNANINTGSVAQSYDRLSAAEPSVSFTGCRYRG